MANHMAEHQCRPEHFLRDSDMSAGVIKCNVFQQEHETIEGKY